MDKSFHNIVAGKKYLNIGEVKLINQEETIWTVLGSCISIIFHSQKHNVGIICHAQLPEKRNYHSVCSDTCPKPCFRSYNTDNDLRYVSCAFRYMFETLRSKGISPDDITTHVYGGASIFQLKISTKSQSIGEQNADVALKMLRNEGIRINHKDIGGNKGRRLIFYGETGKVFVEAHK